jgi:enamine deaminase RidA (YjgF/YER057c/UK114 family)
MKYYLNYQYLPKGAQRPRDTYAYDKIKRVLAHHGADLSHVVKVTTYITDLRHRVTLGKCVGDTWDNVTFPANTVIGVGA